MAQITAIPPERPKPRIRGPVLTLVVFPSRRAQFFSNLRAAFAPGARRLPSEIKLGQDPGRWFTASMFLHAIVLGLWLMLPNVLPKPPVVVQQEEPPKDNIVYYQADALPEMDDSGGSKVGHSGRSGGREAFHPTQVIRVSRGPTILPSVVDTPELSLPRIKVPAANLLSLAAAPAPAAPVLAPAPVTVHVERTDSKIVMPATTAPKPNLRVAPGTMPELTPMPTSAVAKAEPEKAITLPPRPRPALPTRANVDVASSSTSELSMAQLQPVPALAPAGDPKANGSGGPMKTETVVISTNSGEAVGAPMNGAPGSLAMSPKGHAQPGIGGEGGGGSGTARGTGPGSSAAAAGPGGGSSGAGPGSSPAAAGGISVARGSGGSGNNGVSAIPGVVVRGGVVTLDSFGPKAAPDAKSSPASQPRKAAAITVIATARSGGGLNAYHLFKGQQVYTVYLDTKAGPVVLQFAGHETTPAYNGNLTPPDPFSTDVPELPPGSSIVLSCLLDEAGHVQNVHLLKSALQSTEALLEAVRNWQFHPALSRGQPVAVDALIGIGMGVR